MATYHGLDRYCSSSHTQIRDESAAELGQLIRDTDAAVEAAFEIAARRGISNSKVRSVILTSRAPLEIKNRVLLRLVYGLTLLRLGKLRHAHIEIKSVIRNDLVKDTLIRADDVSAVRAWVKVVLDVVAAIVTILTFLYQAAKKVLEDPKSDQWNKWEGTASVEKNTVIEEVLGNSTIEDCTHVLVINKVSSGATLTILTNNHIISIEKNEGTVIITDNDDSLAVRNNEGTVSIDHNSDTVVIDNNTGTVEIRGNSDTAGVKENAGEVKISGNSDTISVTKNEPGGRVTVSGNDDTINIGNNDGTVNVDGNEDLINVADNAGGTINAINNNDTIKYAGGGTVTKGGNPGTITKMDGQD